jgi:glycosyltransferase involved in cell wall biosynthesis
VKQSLVERGIPSQKIHVIPYGVDVYFWGKAWVRDKPTNEKLIFIYTASIALRKGVHYLIQAWRDVNLPTSELWICGFNYLPKCKEFKNFPPTIKFLGPKSHSELLEIYKRAHIYVLPSLFEGLARSGLEAMASGLPCIATWESGLTDFIRHGENGWVVPSANSDALAEILRECFKNRFELGKFSEKAFETGQLNSWERYGNRCAEVAKHILSKS